MVETMEFELTPYGETCVQVGSEHYYDVYKHEAKAFIAQLERMFPKAKELLTFRVKGFSHDFGTYHQIVVAFREESEQEELVYEIESNLPEFWDEQAKEYLTANLPKEYLETLEWGK